MAAAAHSTVTAQGHFAVQPVAGQIHEAPSAFENPALQGKVHLACPIFGMNRQYQHTVGIQIQRTVVQLGFGVIIVIETLPLQPAEQPPLSWGLAALDASADRVGDFGIVKDVIVRLRAIEGERQELLVAPPPHAKRFPAKTVQVLAGIHDRARRQSFGINVITAASEIVVCVPRVRGCEHGDFRLRTPRCNHPRKRERLAGWRSGPQIIEAYTIGGRNGGPLRESALIPLQARLSEIAIRQQFPVRVRAVLIHPPDHAHELFLEAVPPKRQLILLGSVDPMFGPLSAPYPLRPHVAEQPVAKQSEVERRITADRGVGGFGTIAGFAQRHTISAGLQIAVVSALWRRAQECDIAAFLGMELGGCVRQRQIHLIAHISQCFHGRFAVYREKRTPRRNRTV